jgi:hypothetical protein
MIVIETITIIRKTIFIPMIQNRIKVSFLNYLIFFIFYFNKVNGIKKKQRMEPYILAQFYALAYVFLSSRICQCQSIPSKRKKTCYLVIKINLLSLISSGSVNKARQCSNFYDSFLILLIIIIRAHFSVRQKIHFYTIITL